MTRANDTSNRGARSDTNSSRPIIEELHSEVGRLSSRIFQRLSFWSAIVLPFAALAVLIAQPPWWGTLLVAVFLLNGLAVYAGHCHGMEC